MTTKDLTISLAAVKLILDIEGLSHADWPGGASGVTIGRGYDLGYHTVDELLADWGGRLPAADLERLRPCCGVKGLAARELARKFITFRIPQEVADAVFLEVDLPRWIQRAADTWPGYDLLPDDVQGALVSLVYNRGTSMRDRDGRVQERREMREIRHALLLWSARPSAADRWRLWPQLRAFIAREIRSMKRLWENKNLGGLLRRRDAEAQLVEGAELSLPVADPQCEGLR